MTNEAGEPPTEEARKEHVRDRYGEIARGHGCCGTPSSSGSDCCAGSSASACGGRADSLLELGYTAEELAQIPDGANLGLGCGNPTALLSLGPGEVVLDLGSGAGVDCFLAATKVGPTGRVIGVDMTPSMVSRARANARASGIENVEFRLGEIEHLPVADRSVDVVLSNCVVNLVPDKAAVYREAFRVLRPGGRLAIADVVATRPITAAERNDLALWSSCSSGALRAGEVESLLAAAGFREVTLRVNDVDPVPVSLEGPVGPAVRSAEIRAVRPA